MCGRYTLATPAEELVEEFDVPYPTFELHPRYNVAPGQMAPVVAQDRKGRRMGLLKWGFVPAWKDDPGRPLVNARSESVATRRSFRAAFEHRRCLVPADGFYEWMRPEPQGDPPASEARRGSIPYWIHPVEAGPLSFAGIWETWHGATGESTHGFAILTVDANAELAPVHDRMPVVVMGADRSAWLDPATPPDRLREILRPAPDGTFASRRVSPRVNRATDDDPGLIEPLDPS